MCAGAVLIMEIKLRLYQLDLGDDFSCVTGQIEAVKVSLGIHAHSTLFMC